MSRLRIRLARSADAHIIEMLQVACFEHDDPYVNNKAIWHLAFLADKPVGFSAVSRLSDGSWYLARVGVLPHARGHGIQLALIRARLRAVRARGGRIVLTDCITENPASARSLIKAGFRPFWPAAPWGMPTSIYWKLDLHAA